MQHTNGLEDARNYEAEYGGRIGPENRPVFHVSPYTGWANDPNGFSVYKVKERIICFINIILMKQYGALCNGDM